MANLIKSFSLSGLYKQSDKLTIPLILLLAICSFSRGEEVEYGDGIEMMASTQTNTYVFMPDQSTVMKTGGFAGVHETYTIEGQFQLSVDFGEGMASFTKVDANLIDESGLLFERSLDAIFNLTELTSTIVDDTIIEFEGKTADGTESDILLRLALRDDSIHLTGRTIPPPNSADFFLYELEAITLKKYGGGTGEPNNPYKIATAEQLISIGSDPTALDKHFVLVNDIDLDPNLPGGKVFTRAVIANDTNDADDFQGIAFTGSFDGTGQTIRNLAINNNNADYLGLFGYIGPEGNVQNLALENISIIGSKRTGGLAGFSNGTISNSHVTGIIHGSDRSRWLGGLVGTNTGNIRDCYTSVGITIGNRSWMLGGLVGLHRGSIENCYAIGNISGGNSNFDHGGLVGACYWGNIKDSHATGNVSSGDDSWCIGGLVGNTEINCEITNCYSVGIVTVGNNSDSIGGLVGGNSYSDISNCYTISNISGGNGSRYFGGLVGSNMAVTINDCYAKGNVSGYIFVGGLVGEIRMGSKVTNCYAAGRVSSSIDTPLIGGLVADITEYVWVRQCFWDIETSGQSTSAAGTGKTTAQMQDIQTYQDAGWDMASDRTDGTMDIWQIPQGGGYPELTIFSEVYQQHKLNGSGTPENPYQIATAEDLGAIFRYDRTASYKLMVDIDLTGITWGNAPIPKFNGIFDGNGNRIKNLTIQGGTKDSLLGLFGLVEGNGKIQNLGLENVSITGEDDSSGLGGLAGSNSGIINNCYITGSISGGDGSRDIGGLVGRSHHGKIAYCYAIGSISHEHNTENIGGLVGYSIANINQCYASVEIISGENFSYLGGLVGHNLHSDEYISNCFWDIQKSGLSEMEGCTGLTTAQMQDPNIFIEAGWDFINTPDGPSDIWAQPIEGGTPILWWQLQESELPPLPAFAGGSGEPNDPYLLSTANELNHIGYNPRLMAAHFKLTNDIDLTNDKFFIIGNETFPFVGFFDGNSHTISNFAFTSTNKNQAGLFGYIDEPNAEVRNLGLIDPNVNSTTESNVGSLVGQLESGTITGCYVQGGSVSGIGFFSSSYSARSIVGGLVGSSDGTISNCHSNCDVFGHSCAGGLVGRSGGIMINCTSSGKVSGNNCAGGLLGVNSGEITNCDSNGNISGNTDVGGLVGSNSEIIINCRTSADAVGIENVGGLVGDNTGTISNSYASGSASGNNIIGGLVGSNGYIQTWDLYWETPGWISNCYSAVSVFGENEIGGLLGLNYVGEVSNSFWDIQISGQLDSAGGIGKTTSEMQTAITFINAGWDFENIWIICEGKDYPRLKWEQVQCEQ